MFQDQNALRLRMHKLIQSSGYDVDLSADAEIAFVSKALELNGQHTFDINDDQVFVTCVGEGCNSCFLKRKRANISTSCKKCIDKKRNDKRYGERKEIHKEM